MTRVPSFAIALASALVIPTIGGAGERPLDVRVVPHVAPAPGSLRVFVSVAPNEGNRSLSVELDSAALYRRSELPLNGAKAARRHTLTFTHLPQGVYEIRVRVTGRVEEVADVQDFVVTPGKDR